MKKLFYILLLLGSTYVFAQNKGMTYQAVIYAPGGQNVPGVNVANVPMTNRTICLQFSLLDASSGLEYQEVVKTKTDEFGMVNITIGSGTQTGGYATSFGVVVWSASADKSMKVALDATGLCNQYEELSVEKLDAVPFANAAITAGNVTGVVALTNGGTGATTAAGARTNLGIGNVDNTSDLNKPMSTATKTYVDSQLTNSTIVDADANTKGKVQLAGDLAGTAAAPTVPGLALKENAANKSTTTTLGTSNVLFPTQNAVKTYVDTAIAGATIVDADANTKGKIQLAGDLAGTAAAPTVPGLALKLDASLAGVPNGIATLNSAGIIPANQLPPISVASTNVVGSQAAMLALSNATVGSIAVRTDLNKNFILSTAGPSVLANWIELLTPGAPVQSVNGLTGAIQLSKSDINLANVDNTSDAAKPISTATQNALNLKLNTNQVGVPNGTASLNALGKIPTEQIPAISFSSVKVLGSQAEMLAQTNALIGSVIIRTDVNKNYVLAQSDPTILANWVELLTPAPPVQSVNGYVGNVSLTKADLGLSNVDNTGDINKPVSTATQTALDLKANLASPSFTGTVSGITKSMVGLANVDNTTDLNKPVSTATQTALDLKANTVDLTAESTRATAAEATLTTNVATNATAIAAETTRATAAEATLTTNVATNATAIAAETTRATAAEATLTTNVATNATAIAAETTRATAAEATLTTNVATNATAIAAETTRATAAEALKANATDVTTSLALKEDVSNKSTTPTLGTSDTLYPSQNAVKTYVDTSIAGATIVDANGSTKGKLKLAGDLAGTADLPEIATGAVTSTKILDGTIAVADIANDAVETTKIKDANVTYAKIQNVSATNKVLGRVSTGAGVIEEIATTGSGNVVRASSPNLITPDLGTPSAVVLTNATDLPLTTGVIGILPEANGGTGSATKNFVDLTTNQTIAGSKSFDSDITANGVTVGKGSGNGDSNVAVGTNLGTGTGYRNTGVGAGALQNFSGTSFGNNTGVGYANMQGLTTGYGNTSLGGETLASVATSDNNTAIGNQTLRNAVSSNNTALGASAGNGVTSGANNTFLGSQADTNSGTISNATAIGQGAIVSASNTVQIGNSSVTSVKTDGVLTSNGYIKTGGTASQFLKADGSVDSNGYLFGTVPLTNGGTGATTAAAALTNLGAEPTANKSTATDLGNSAPSDVLFPSQKAVKAYVDTQTAAAGVSDGSITSAKIADGTIVNADIATNAAIAYSKLNLASSIVVGDLAVDAVETAKVKDANITYAKIQNVATGKVLGRVSANAGVVEEIATTGTGDVVRATSPTLVTPVLGAATGTSLSVSGQLTSTVATGTAPFVVTSTTPVANLSIGGNAATVTTNANLTGDVTSSGNATTIGANKVVTGMIANATITNAKLDKANIPLSGFGAAAADVALGANKLTGVADPTLAQDAATKYYVDTATAGITTLSDGKIYLGNASNVATEVTPSGDVTMTNAGVTAIGTGKVVVGMLATDAVETIKIKDANVTEAKLAADAVTSAKILNGTIVVADLAANAVEEAKIKDANVTTAKLADAAVTTAKITDANITTAKLADTAVTTAKITDANVTYAKIQNVSATDKVLGRVTAGAGVVEEIATTGSGNVVRATSPTLVTPVIGAATGNSLSVSGQLTSTVATGTAPMVVTSTTPVANLSIGGNAATATKATNIDGGVLGSVPYQSAAGTTSLLAGNTSATAKYLTSTGDGTSAAAPTWTTLTLGSTNLDGLSDAKVEGTNFSGSMILGHQTTGTLSNATVNTAVGIGAMSSITQGDMNVAVGYNALKNVTTGETNNAFGHEALFSTTTGYQNVGIGSTSLYSNTTGYLNTSMGYQSLRYNTTGNSNVGIGSESMLSNTTGNNNSVLGSRAMQYSGTGGQNVSIGFESLRWNASGSSNTGLGYRALLNNATGNYNTAIGSDADISADGLSNATAVGAMAIVNASNTIQLGNTSVTSVNTSGKLTSGAVTYPNTDGTSGQVLTTNGSGTVSFAAIPSTNLASGVTGVLPVANGGTGSATKNFVDLTTDQTIAGVKTLSSDIVVNSVNIGRGKGAVATNTAVGTDAISATATGADNTALGYNTLKAITSGSGNTAVGSQAALGLTTGTGNTVFGTSALSTVTSSQSNTAIGNDALKLLGDSTNDRNTAVGTGSFANLTTGQYNVGVGQGSLLNTTSGSNNVAVGKYAGFRATNNSGVSTSNKSIFIGSETKPLNPTSDNEIVIGYDGRGLGNNTTVIGNTLITQAKVFGALNLPDATTSTTATTGALTVAGGAGIAENLNVGGNAKITGTLSIAGGTPGVGKVLTSDANGLGTWTTPTGVTTMAAIGSTPNANGATISGVNLNLEPASASYGGIVTTGTQTFAGAKTFSPAVTAASFLGVGTKFSPTLTAAANADILVGLDIDPTFTNGSYSALTNYALRVQGIGFGRGGGAVETNTAIGSGTLINNTTGANNTGLGYRALVSNSIGSGNTAFGTLAGAYIGPTNSSANSSGTNSTFIGYNTSPLANGDDNEVVIAGGNATTRTVGLGSNTTLIGNAATTQTRIMGALDLPNTTASTSSTSGALKVGGGAGIAGAIYAGSIQNTPIGSTTASTGAFTTLAASGNATVAGTLAVTGATTLSSTLGVTGDVAVNTDKFKIAASSGNTEIAGTIKIAGGTPGAGKVLVSDANGLASWSSNSNGGASLISATATMAATATYNLIVFSGSTASQTITLPSATDAGAGREITIKNIASVPVTINATAGNLISDSTTTGATSLSIGIEPSNNWIKAISTGSNWIILRALF